MKISYNMKRFNPHIALDPIFLSGTGTILNFPIWLYSTFKNYANFCWSLCAVQCLKIVKMRYDCLTLGNKTILCKQCFLETVEFTIKWKYIDVFSRRPPTYKLKPWQNKSNLNDVTAALFLVFFFAAGSWEKDTQNRAAVTS